MRIWGKILGAVFGFMFAGFFGMLFGIWLGHRFDCASAMNFNMQNGLFGQSESSKEKQKVFFSATFSVMGHVAKSKGKVTESDIQVANAYMAQMRLDSEARRQAQDSFAEGKKSYFPLEQVLTEFVEMVNGDRNVLQMFLGIQVQMAYSDGELSSSEKTILYTISECLGFTRPELERLLQMIEGQYKFHQRNTSQQETQSSEDSYKVLGVDEDTSDLEVKRAYRKLMSQNHPDKLASKGLPPEMMELAKEKTQDIQRAYEVIRKKRGLK